MNEMLTISLQGNLMELVHLLGEPAAVVPAAVRQLKVTIPIVPVLLSYEGEIELSSRLDLAEVWRALLRRIERPNARTTQKS